MGSGWGMGGIAGTPPGGGGGDNAYRKEEFTLTSTDISNKYVLISFAPTDPLMVSLTVVGGSGQDYSIDFISTLDNEGRRVSWSGLGLDGILAAGDTISIEYPVRY
jgi:hypothetical protein